jgi:hypothetical protein
VDRRENDRIQLISNLCFLLENLDLAMASSFSKTVITSLLLAAATGQAAVLAPANDIVFPSSKTAQNPLQYAGANTPYLAGPNVNGVENTVPDKCTVQQAAYIVRHGSR